MSAQRPTVDDVAKLAGVSPTSVSRVCRPNPRLHVSDDMRIRVMQAIEELNYQPNTVARSLRTRRVGSVGFYDTYGLIWLSDRLSSEIFIGLQLGCADRHQELLVVRPMLDAGHLDIARALSRTKTDAIVCLPGARNQALIDNLSSGSKAVVTIGEAIASAPAVVGEDVDGSRRLARHLYERGHRKVLYLSDFDNHISAQRRLAGFTAEAESIGLDVQQIVVTPGNGEIQDEIKTLLSHRSSNGITAVACWHDFAAVRVLNHCVRSGIKVPDEIAVVGFDGLDHREIPEGLALTTINVNWRSLSRQAVNTAVDIVSGKEALPELVIPSTLTIGNTT